MTNTETPTSSIKRLTELPKDGNRRVVDLAASRAARAELQGPPPLLKLSDDELYELPPTMSADFVTAIAEAGTFVESQDIRLLSKFDEALEALLGPELFGELRGRLDFADRMALLEGALTVYDLTLPES